MTISRSGARPRESGPSARAPHITRVMKLSIRVLFGVALLAGCATAPRIEQPLVLDFHWDPAFTEKTTGFGRPKVLSTRGEIIGRFMRDNFEITFSDVVLGDDPAAPARVELKVMEHAYPRLGNRAPQRCGTVEYAVFVAGTERSRETFALDCDVNGEADYQRAALRAAQGTAKVMARLAPQGERARETERDRA
jgi:hypothetical protein